MATPNIENLQVQLTYPATSVNVSREFQLPIIDSNKLSQAPGVLGGLAFDMTTGKTWECVRQFPVIWRPIGSGGGGGGGSSLDYGLKKTAPQNIPPLSEVVLNTFSTAIPYVDNTLQWNTATGVFTSTGPQTFVITAEIAWAANVNNQGSRHLRIYYKPFVGPEQIVRETITQANPSQTEPTPQTASIGLALASGDQVYVKVYQNSGVNLSIDSSGAYTGHITNPV